MPILMFIYTPVISSILICVENKVLIYLHIKSQVVNLSIRKTTILGINRLAKKGKCRMWITSLNSHFCSQ
jgi:hypothetical protein